MSEVSEKICTFCSKAFTTKRNCLNHLLICKIKKQREHDDDKNHKEFLQNKIKILEQELCKKDEQIKYQKLIIDSFEQNFKSKSTTQNNTQNNITIYNTSQYLKDVISNLEPINFTEIKDCFEHDFSNKYIDQGIEGLARFICEVPCQNKFITTDYSRKVIAYKNSEQQVVTDPKANILLNTAIKQNADIIIDKAEDRYNYWKSQISELRDSDIEPGISDIECKTHTKKLKNIAKQVKDNISIDNNNATNFIILKGIENKNITNSIE